MYSYLKRGRGLAGFRCFEVSLSMPLASGPYDGVIRFSQ